MEGDTLKILVGKLQLQHALHYSTKYTAVCMYNICKKPHQSHLLMV